MPKYAEYEDIGHFDILSENLQQSEAWRASADTAWGERGVHLPAPTLTGESSRLVISALHQKPNLFF